MRYLLLTILLFFPFSASAFGPQLGSMVIRGSGEGGTAIFGPVEVTEDGVEGLSFNGNGNDADGNIVGVYSSTSYDTCWRWSNVTIPAGVTIVTAYVIAEGTWETGSDMTGLLTGIADAIEYTTTAPSAQSKVTSTVAWSPTLAEWDSGGENQTPSIVDIIQDIVDDASWSSGDSLGIIWEDDGSGLGSNNARQSDDLDRGTIGAELYIEYTN